MLGFSEADAVHRRPWFVLARCRRLNPVMRNRPAGERVGRPGDGDVISLAMPSTGHIGARLGVVLTSRHGAPSALGFPGGRALG